MKKTVYIGVILLFMNCFCLRSGALMAGDDDASSAAPEKERKFFEAMFGILPNPDGEINNLASVRLNYTRNLSSSLIFYSREYAKVDRNTTNDGDDVEKINSMKRRDVRLNAIEYNQGIIDSGGFGLAVLPELTINYYDEEKTRELNSTWDSDINIGTKELYFERMRYDSMSVMPVLEAALKVSLRQGVSFYVGGGYIPISFDTNGFDEFGSSTDADPALQRESYYEAEYKVHYTSMGFTAKGGIALTGFFFGSVMIDFYYLYKFGDSTVKDSWWNYDLERNIVDKYSVVDKRTIINIDVYYQMDFLAFRGIIPTLKFGWLKQRIVLDNEEEPDLSYNKFDFGIALKF